MSNRGSVAGADASDLQPDIVSLRHGSDGDFVPENAATRDSEKIHGRLANAHVEVMVMKAIPARPTVGGFIGDLRSGGARSAGDPAVLAKLGER